METDWRQVGGKLGAGRRQDGGGMEVGWRWDGGGMEVVDWWRKFRSGATQGSSRGNAPLVMADLEATTREF